MTTTDNPIQAQVQKSLYKTPIVDTRNTLGYSDRALYAPKQTRARFLPTCRCTGNYSIATGDDEILRDNLAVTNLYGNLNRTTSSTGFIVPQQGTYIMSGTFYMGSLATSEEFSVKVFNDPIVGSPSVIFTGNMFNLTTASSSITIATVANFSKGDNIYFFGDNLTALSTVNMFFDCTIAKLS